MERPHEEAPLVATPAALLEQAQEAVAQCNAPIALATLRLLGDHPSASIKHLTAAIEMLNAFLCGNSDQSDFLRERGTDIVTLLQDLHSLCGTRTPVSTDRTGMQQQIHTAICDTLSTAPVSSHPVHAVEQEPEPTLAELIEQAKAASEREERNARTWEKKSHTSKCLKETVFNRFWENVITQYGILKENQELQTALQVACRRIDRLRDPAKLDPILRECSRILRDHYLRHAIGSQLVTILSYDFRLPDERKQELLALFPQPDDDDPRMRKAEIAARKRSNLFDKPHGRRS